MRPAMETMEIIDTESQMTVLQDTLAEEQMNDEEEDLNNSLREAVQDEDVKPKLQCLMMDPSFSMVTVQSEDSGIVWETASSRCSTPWASERNVTTPEPGYTLSSPGTAGKILVTMDEELATRRERKKQKAEKWFPYTSDEIMRPAMVEVSLPNVTQTQDKTTHTREEKHQRLFSLVSEGSEILNIIAPPKVSTVDEEESEDLEDCLFYLEEVPAIKSTKISHEPVNVPTETPGEDEVTSFVPEPIIPVPAITGSRRGVTADDYFENYTLLDTQTPSGEAALEEAPGDSGTEDTVTQNVNDVPEPSCGLSQVPSAVSVLDIPGEHLDDVFYGGGSSAPPSHDNKKEERGELSKSQLKASGSALFGSEEMVLTPIYLPGGPPKIIDPNLLEEPKAMAFFYSDLYADAVGSRKKQDDDTESLTSEKSFHSRESDSEDRGYLEKFVLRVETLNIVDCGDQQPEVRSEEHQDPFRLAGYVEQPKTEVETKTDELEELTDFFRSSASSSPWEAVDLYRTEPETEPQGVRTTPVTFKDEVKKNETESRVEGSNSLPFTDDIEFAEAFLPVEISEDCPAWEENLQTFYTTTASTRTDEQNNKPKSVSETESPKMSQAINLNKPIIPRYKPFLDLIPLLPAETEDEEQQTEGVNVQEDKSVTVSEETTSPEAKEEDEKTETHPPPPPPDV
ncbi:cardiomyopathy-associated protein 5 [Triplophysa rosa]|uniref:Cardiomyopathy-associated protein 5-like n=1 Tax=Triplophysa rosa TaxID=992332 RepID=A0A9W7W8Z3_TRIRA|nr:cardiomyopathy-associated protein 5 [Triplophysa rosa]XP_057183112.1 cardiomyopathy-associated protein 5 [Triplophysa rosa]KAI7789829.1 putative cardiomyopathy-associated protein 5-like [Triplophysa rosa]